MLLNISCSDLGSLIEQGFFLRLLHNYSQTDISRIHVRLKNDAPARILDHKPKTSYGFQLMKSYQKLAHKVFILSNESLIENEKAA
jgi:hypothetical protein